MWTELFAQCPDLVTALLREFQVHCLYNSPPLYRVLDPYIRVETYRRIMTRYMDRLRTYLREAMCMPTSTWTVAFGTSNTSDADRHREYAQQRLIKDVHALLSGCESELRSGCYYRLPNVHSDELLRPLVNKLPLIAIGDDFEHAIKQIVRYCQPCKGRAMLRCIEYFGYVGVDAASCEVWRQCCRAYETQSKSELGLCRGKSEDIKRRIVEHGERHPFAYTVLQRAAQWIRQCRQRFFTTPLPLQTLALQIDHRRPDPRNHDLLIDDVVYSMCPSCGESASLVVKDDVCRYWLQSETSPNATTRAKRWNKRRNEDLRRPPEQALGGAKKKRPRSEDAVADSAALRPCPQADWEYTSEAPTIKVQGYVGSCVSLLDDGVYCNVCTPGADVRMQFIVLLGCALVIPDKHLVVVLCCQPGCSSLMQWKPDTVYNQHYWMCGRCESLHHQRMFEQSLRDACVGVIPPPTECRSCAMCSKTLTRHDSTYVYPCQVLLCSSHHRRDLPRVIEEKRLAEIAAAPHFIMNATWVLAQIAAHHEARMAVKHDRDARRFKPSTYASQQIKRNRGGH